MGSLQLIQGHVLCCQSFGFVSKNPILKNITEYLVDEGSYEEEALLGKMFLVGLEFQFVEMLVNV